MKFMIRAAVCLLAATAPAQEPVDKDLPAYRRIDGLKGTLKSVGSDTLNNLMTMWAEGFKKHHPDVTIEIEGKGSTAAPPSLLAGNSQLGPMSREMKPKEIADITAKFGCAPTRLRVACEALAVFVNKACPIDELTLEQVDGIFSKTRRRGAEDITTWGQLGAKGDYADKPISLYGRNSGSGTYGFFKEVALLGGDFRDTVKEQLGGGPTSPFAITDDKFGIGYGRTGYAMNGLKALKLVSKPTCENVYNGSYPLGRFLLIYINRPVDKPLDPVTREFCTFIYSNEGQRIVAKDGFYPLSAAMAAQEVDKLRTLPVYQKIDGIKGQLNSVGSPTLNNVMTMWCERFKRNYRDVNIQVEGYTRGSPRLGAWMAGTAQLLPMSRALREADFAPFEKKFGYAPTALIVGLDALSVFVHKDCPLDSLTMEQVDAIFSKGRKKGHKEDITTWDQIGVGGAWTGKPISLYGRNSASGTYGFFKEVALGGGNFKDSINEQPGSASVVMSVANDELGMGYSGSGYAISRVKMLKLAPKPGHSPIAGTRENVYNETYPLWRPLYLYINKPPEKDLDPLLREFLLLVLSKEGQEVVVKDGFVPLTPKMVDRERAKFVSAGK